MKKKENQKNPFAKFANVFSMIDPALQDTFIHEYLLAAGILILGVVLAIALRKISLIGTPLLISFFLAVITTFRVIRCIEGEILIYEGTCVEVSKMKDRRKYITLEINNDIFLLIYTSRYKKIKKGNIVRAFCIPSSITQKANDLYVTSIPYCIQLVKKNVADNTDETLSKKKQRKF